MTSALITTFGPSSINPLTEPAPPPFNSISGFPENPGCVVPLIVTVLFRIGNPEVRFIVWTPAPGTLNEIVSRPEPSFTALIASRKVQSAALQTSSL